MSRNCIIFNTSDEESSNQCLTFKRLYSIFIKNRGRLRTSVLSKTKKRKGESEYGTAGNKEYNDRRIASD